MPRPLQAPDPESTPRAPSPQFAGLDIIRFAAACMVMLFHLGYWSWADPGSRTNALVGLPPSFAGLGSATWSGWVGVEVFFVLSGLVITWSAQRAGPVDFLRHRVLRLLPAAWICALLTSAALLLFRAASPQDLLKPLARTLSFYPSAPWIDDAFWTLDIEVAFYAVIFCTLALRGSGAILAVVVLLGSLSAMFWMAVALSHYVDMPWIDLTLQPKYARLLDLLLVRHGCFFTIGVLIFYITSDVGRGRDILIAPFALCAAGGVVEIASSTMEKARMTLDPHDPLLPVAIWIGATMLIALSFGRNDLVVRWTRTVNVRQIGLATYPLYLLHTVVGSLCIRLLLSHGVDGTVAIGIAAVTVLGLAFFVSLSIEPLVRDGLRRAIRSATSTLGSMSRLRLALPGKTRPTAVTSRSGQRAGPGPRLH